MSDEDVQDIPKIVIKSSRFGDLSVPADSVIEFPSGMIGFPSQKRFVMLEHNEPFSWLHAVEDSNLAFVVVDGMEFGEQYGLKPPYGDKDCDFKEDDEFAILVIVTVRSDPRMSTANLKAPLFVNIRNKRGVQIIYDDARFSTRHPLYPEDEAKEEGAATPEPPKTPEKK